MKQPFVLIPVEVAHDELIWSFMVDAHARYVRPVELPRERFFEHLRAKRAANDEDLVLVVEGGNPIGFVELSVEQDAARLDEIYLVPRVRHRGFGTRLLNLVEELMIERGATLGLVRAFTANRGALRLYERLGWKRCGTRMLFDVIEQQELQKSLVRSG